MIDMTEVKLYNLLNASETLHWHVCRHNTVQDSND